MAAQRIIVLFFFLDEGKKIKKIHVHFSFYFTFFPIRRSCEKIK